MPNMSGRPPSNRFSESSIAKRISNASAIDSWSKSRQHLRRGLMRILFCNKYNFRFSGTEVYLFELMDLLRAHGHEVALFSMADARGTANAYDAHLVSHVDFRSQQSWWRRARQAPRMIYS